MKTNLNQGHKSFAKFCVLNLSIIIASCTKDKTIYVKPEVVPNKITLITIIKTLKLEGIKYSPSQNPIAFNSIGVGREVNGSKPTIPLSFSGWTHPSVLHFEQKWNGHHYWAAITPYPNTDSQYENPHVFCSDDGDKWIEPTGIKNPIDPCPLGEGYNSDVNLMLNNNVLYCYWRVTEAGGRAIYVKKSEDGVQWGPKQFVCAMPYGLVDLIAPSFIKNTNDQYFCYAVCGPEKEPGSFYSNYSIRRMISPDPTKFNPDKNKGYDLIKVNGRPWGNDQEPWHIEVKKIRNIYMMLVTTTNFNRHGGGGRLFMGYSTDGESFTFSSKPLNNYNSSTYKSSFNPKMDLAQNKVNVEMWRAMMSDGWAVFHENFSINAR